MKRFILKLVLFLFPVITILAVTEYQLRRIPNDINVRREILENQLENWEAIILGSSHGRSAINPHILSDKTLNLATSSQDLFYDTNILLKYLPQLPKLKLVILPISYFSLESKLSDATESWRCAMYYHVYGLPDEAGKWFDSRNSSYMGAYGINDSKLYLQNGFNVNLSGEVDAQGWQSDSPMKPLVDDLIAEGKERVFSHSSAMKATNIKGNMELLSRLMNELSIRKVKVVMITTPCFSSYYQAVNAQAETRWQASIIELKNQYKLEYFDYFRDTRFVSEDFRDSDHLNVRGAVKFSQIIEEEFVAKYLSGSNS